MGNYNLLTRSFEKNVKRVLETRWWWKGKSGYEKKRDYDDAMDTVFGIHSKLTLPVHYLLAKEYSISDEYFSSVPGPTW
jgi:phospholipase C